MSKIETILATGCKCSLELSTTYLTSFLGIVTNALAEALTYKRHRCSKISCVAKIISMGGTGGEIFMAYVISTTSVVALDLRHEECQMEIARRRVRSKHLAEYILRGHFHPSCL